jgi:hypothetical protein
MSVSGLEQAKASRWIYIWEGLNKDIVIYEIWHFHASEICSVTFISVEVYQWFTSPVHNWFHINLIFKITLMIPSNITQQYWISTEFQAYKKMVYVLQEVTLLICWYFNCWWLYIIIISLTIPVPCHKICIFKENELVLTNIYTRLL